MEAFPDFPTENIILGNAKNLVQFDIILDDAIHNVLETPATYPAVSYTHLDVYKRQEWEGAYEHFRYSPERRLLFIQFHKGKRA